MKYAWTIISLGLDCMQASLNAAAEVFTALVPAWCERLCGTLEAEQ